MKSLLTQNVSRPNSLSLSLSLSLSHYPQFHSIRPAPIKIPAAAPKHEDVGIGEELITATTTSSGPVENGNSGLGTGDGTADGAEAKPFDIRTLKNKVGMR